MNPTPYLTNRELLKEIHRSKKTFCAYVDEAHADFDVIVDDRADITPELIAKARLKKPTGDVVIRVMTDEHVPQEAKPLTRKITEPTMAPVRTNFPPFKHFVVLSSGDLKEVCRSHWKGGFDNGAFCQSHGRITNRLALMFMKLVDRYAQRGNWRGYSYLDEMKGKALLVLSQNGLKFNEARSNNPFAFYTQCLKNCFVKVQNDEKKVQNLRDDLFQLHGLAPSHSRQMAHEASFGGGF